MTPQRSLAAETQSDEIATVASLKSDDYVRAKLSDGTIKPEYYAFAEGGRWTGQGRDPSMDSLKFMDVARTISGSLKEQAYYPTRDPKDTRLLIVVYWGKTRTPGSMEDSVAAQDLQVADAKAAADKDLDKQKLMAANVEHSLTGAGMGCGRVQTVADNDQITTRLDSQSASNGAFAVLAAENNARDQLDAQNAMMLGFDRAISETEGLVGTPLEHRRTDLFREIEQQRYFVVLMAYDFQLMWRQKKAKLLWETRFSVRERTNDLSGQLAAMAASAERYFGRDSGKLVHAPLPVGHVDVGPMKTLTLDEHP